MESFTKQYLPFLQMRYADISYFILFQFKFQAKLIGQTTMMLRSLALKTMESQGPAPSPIRLQDFSEPQSCLLFPCNWEGKCY